MLSVWLVCPLKFCLRQPLAFVPVKHRNLSQYPSASFYSTNRTINGIQALHASNNFNRPETEKFEELMKPNTVRITSNFSEGIWDNVWSFFSSDNQMVEMCTKEIEELKEKVRSMIIAIDTQPTIKIILIDTLDHLGISYHFEKEIEAQLTYYFDSYSGLEDDDLYTLALKFRVFRQHGYYMPCDIFDKFRDGDGKFNQTLTNDVKGLLSLYEASHLRIHGETTLEEALIFTTAHLNSILPQLSPNLAKQVTHSLEHSFHKGMQKIEARYYIYLYEENKSINEALLRFAKIDFNLGQLVYKQELYEIKRWWKDLSKKMGYSRDVVMENYFFAFAMIFEPCYSAGRMVIAKAALILTLIDDTYDSYGTLEELKIFTNGVQRWDISETHKLPDYLQLIYEVLLNFIKDIEDEMFKHGKSYCAHLPKVVVKNAIEAQYVDAKWFLEGNVPSFDEYLSNCMLTCFFQVFTYLSFMFVGENADPEVFDWLQTHPKLLKAAATFCRILDDIRDYEDEKKRGRHLSSISCYMKQHDMQEEEVIDEFYKMLEDEWKNANEGCLKPNPIPMTLLVRQVNLLRVIAVVHKYADGCTHPEKSLLKDHIISMFLDPIPL